MRWRKRDIWKFGIPIAGLLLLLVLMVWVPVSAAGAYAGMSGPATPTPATAQATPTVDLMVTALAKEHLVLQNKQLEQSNDRGLGAWVWSNAAAVLSSFLSTLVVVIGAFITFRQWRTNRNDTLAKESKDRQEAQDKELRDREDARRKELEAQSKDLKAQAEERFKAAVTALGSRDDGTQIGGAILLRSFLNPEDKEIYGRYYTQIFDLAVAYLRTPPRYQPPADPDRLPPPTEDSSAPVSLTPLRQALISVFKEVFPLAHHRLNEQDPKTQFNPQSLDASHVNLDNAYLSHTDLKEVWMPNASLRGASLEGADFTKANLANADFREAQFRFTDFTYANLEGANLRVLLQKKAMIW